MHLEIDGHQCNNNNAVNYRCFCLWSSDGNCMVFCLLIDVMVCIRDRKGWMLSGKPLKPQVETAEEGLVSLPPKWKGKGGSKSYLDSYLLNTS